MIKMKELLEESSLTNEKVSGKKFKVKNKRQDYEKNEDILLRQMQEQQRLCDADD